MKNIFNYILSATFILALTACNEDEILSSWVEQNPETEAPTGDAGDLDFSNYVALGNSLTAGFADGALYPEGQASSYPSILAAQFALAGGGSFVYPDISSGKGFGGVDGESMIIGKRYIDVPAALVNPANAIQSTAGEALTQSTIAATDLNNFGVPGAKMMEATIPGYGAVNPFFGAFQSSASASMLSDAVAANPTFFSVWLGSNDVLRYARGGGLNEAEITSAGDFQTALVTVLTGLSGSEKTKGVIINVPPVTLAPFFQIVTTLSGGVNILPAGSIGVATAGFLNSTAAYGAYNAGLDQVYALINDENILSPAEVAIRKITFVADSANAPVITDESLTDLTSYGLASMRQAQVINGVSDLFPLTALRAVGMDAGAGIQGIAVPLPDQYTLTVDEQVNVITGYATYNTIISGVLASFPNVTLVDIGPIFADIYGLSPAQAAGLQLSPAAQVAADGVLGTKIGGYNMVPLSLDPCCLFNSLWSADGIHPNSRGAAVVANEIIKALNAAHKTSILEVDVLSYTGINVML